MAKKTQRVMPRMRIAWEKGQALFQVDLARANDNQEEMEYLSMIDFVVSCFTYVSALNTYPHDRALQAWTIDGYMLARWRHFFTEEEAGGE